MFLVFFLCKSQYVRLWVVWVIQVVGWGVLLLFGDEEELLLFVPLAKRTRFGLVGGFGDSGVVMGEGVGEDCVGDGGFDLKILRPHLGSNGGLGVGVVLRMDFVKGGRCAEGEMGRSFRGSGVRFHGTVNGVAVSDICCGSSQAQKLAISS